MEGVKIEKKPYQLLHIKNAYKIAAAAWIIECVMQNMAECTSHLNTKERDKVNKEVDKLIEVIRNKRHKWHKNK